MGEEKGSPQIKQSNLKGGIWKCNLENLNFYMDIHLRIFLGYHEGEISTWDEFISRIICPYDNKIIKGIFERLLEGITKSFSIAHKVIFKNGKTIAVYNRGSVIDNEITGFIIEDNNSFEYKLFREIFNSAPEGFSIIKPDGTILYTNKMEERFFNKSKDKLIGQSISTTINNKKTTNKILKYISNLSNKKPVPPPEYLTIDNENREIFIEMKGRVLEIENDNLILLTKYDISKRKRIEKRIKSLVKKNHALLHEINHRVKNNLQLISSLISLQSSHTTNPETSNILKKLQKRIHTIAVAHELLSNVNMYTYVNAKIYLQNLINHIWTSFDPVKNTRLMCFIEPVRMDIECAIACGIIINELITNAILHSSINIKKGLIITVSLAKKENNHAELTISDNGKGISSSIDLHNPKTLGLKLVNIFARQINADIHVRMDQGTTFIFRFPVKSNINCGASQ